MRLGYTRVMQGAVVDYYNREVNEVNVTRGTPHYYLSMSHQHYYHIMNILPITHTHTAINKHILCAPGLGHVHISVHSCSHVI